MSKILKAALMVSAVSTLAACASTGSKDAPVHIPEVRDPAPIVSGTMRPYQIRGRWYHPKHEPNYDETGLASWYGSYHHGRPTSTGEGFDMNALTAAHKTLPLPSLVEVTNTANGRRAVLRVNDRGPFVDRRIIDLSKGAAEELGLMARGVGEVRVRYLGPAPRSGGGMALSASSAAAPAPTPTVSSASRRDAPTADRGAVPYSEVVASERQVARPAPVASVTSQSAYSSQGRVYLPGAAPIHNSVVPASRVPTPVPAPVAAPVVPAPVPVPVPVPRPEPVPAAIIPPPVAPIVAAPLPAPAPEPAPVYVPTPVMASAPAPVAQSAPAPITVPSVLTGHWVQAAAYADAATAQRFADRLGPQALVQPFPANGQTFYRILVGPWPDANAAERARQAIIARGYREALLISAS
jgi:rare lipoprotein A